MDLLELVWDAAVPRSQLAQKHVVPLSAAGASALLEEGDVEKRHGQNTDQKRWEPVGHDAEIVTHRVGLGDRPSTGKGRRRWGS